MTTLTALKKKVVERLTSFGIERSEARREAELIVEHVTGMSFNEQIKAGAAAVADADVQTAVEAVLERRSRREPLQYVIGHTIFRGMKYVCRNGAFIPRDDTEIVVTTALELLPPRSEQKLRVLEVGPGAGTICIALLASRDDIAVTALEISPIAAGLTRENAHLNNVASRLEVIECDWRTHRFPTKDVGNSLQHVQGYDLLVSNPPYIPRRDQPGLQAEVGLWEPEEALFGADDDGLATYRELSTLGLSLLRRGGWLVVEIGDGAERSVTDIFKAKGWNRIAAHHDVNGSERAISAQAPD